MADTFDSGIDKQRLLDEIVGASDDPLPPLIPSTPPSFPDDLPPSLLATDPTAAPEAELRPRGWRATLAGHRRELAAIFTAFVGAIWISVGLTTRGGFAGLLGVAFLLTAGAIWLADLWLSD